MGDYRLLRVLGEGAAGQVFLAEQQQPLRQVAIKVLRSASSLSRARFEREVDLLARLEHTNIARLYDSGTETGPTGQLPYLVMEYVQGHDLIRYADAQQLNMEQRLALLAQVARAAHFAHTRGVIHRDLKPCNILVNERGEPKILDFGIAHVVADEATQMTGAGEVLGTLSYMSWEQLCGEGHLVDARADVYALGVIGYQLVSGQQPYPGLTEETLVGALGRLQREAPQKLSAHRTAASGDVETIIGKAMAREAVQRYGSAAEFAADIERFLTRQPIEARPPTATYLLSLLIRRHKVASAAAAVAVVSLLAGVAAATWFAVGESRARADAEARTAEALAANEFLQQMFTSATPEVARGRQLSATDVLDYARVALEAPADSTPERVRAQLHRGLGSSYAALGQLGTAREQLERALALAKLNFPPGDPARLHTQDAYARVLLLSGDFVGAESALRAALKELPASERHLHRYHSLTAALGQAVCEQQRFDACDELLRPALQQAEKDLGPDHDLTLEMMEWRCFALMPQYRFEDIEELAVRMHDAVVARHGPDHPRSFRARDWLATAAAGRNELTVAERRMRALLQDRIRVQGAEHPDIAPTQHRFGMLLLRTEKWAEAREVLNDAWRNFEQARGPDDVGTLVSMTDLATALEKLGKSDQGFELRAQIAQRIEAMSRPITSPDASLYGYYAAALDERGEHNKALQIFQRLEPDVRRLKYASSPSLGQFIGAMGRCLANNGQIDAALQYLAEAEQMLTAAVGAGDERTQTVRRWREEVA